MKNKYDYVVYIDESGDDGFKESSSKFFGFSAVIIRKINDINLATVQKEILLNISKDKQKPKKDIHFTDFCHEKRKYICDSIAQRNLPIRVVNCISIKETILSKLKQDFTKDRYKYFNYILRHLLERVSWFIRDDKSSKEKKTLIILSNRKQMQLELVKKYIDSLKNDLECRMDHSIVQSCKIKVANHNQLAGLQFADIFASSLRRFFFEKDKFDSVEIGYSKKLKKYFYHKNNKFDGYGMKILYLNDVSKKNMHQETLQALKEIFGFKI